MDRQLGNLGKKRCVAGNVFSTKFADVKGNGLEALREIRDSWIVSWVAAWTGLPVPDDDGRLRTRWNAVCIPVYVLVAFTDDIAVSPLLFTTS